MALAHWPTAEAWPPEPSFLSVEKPGASPGGQPRQLDLRASGGSHPAAVALVALLQADPVDSRRGGPKLRFHRNGRRRLSRAPVPGQGLRGGDLGMARSAVEGSRPSSPGPLEAPSPCDPSSRLPAGTGQTRASREDWRSDVASQTFPGIT
jgi:hypothetical protein